MNIIPVNAVKVNFNNYYNDAEQNLCFKHYHLFFACRGMLWGDVVALYIL